MRDILELTEKELKEFLQNSGERQFRAGQIFNWIYQKSILDFSLMSDLPAGLREKLNSEFYILGLSPEKVLTSRDQTQKFLFKTLDGNFIEAVNIPAGSRTTACLSTQAGCKFACSFCASAKAGFKRNLTTGEIIDQLLYLKSKAKASEITHVVFMGTGEPLDNYENLLSAIRRINSPEGFNIGARRITISTCGLIPEMARLAGEGLQVELSISLHAADDRIRSTLMPINKKYPLKELIRAAKAYFAQTGRQVTFEYLLIKDLNSDLQSARNLCTILSGWNCKVNLIAANPIKEFNIHPPAESAVLKFGDSLTAGGLRYTIRKSRGQDIDAACGQLRLQYEKD